MEKKRKIPIVKIILAAVILFAVAAVLAGIWKAAKEIGVSLGKKESSDKIATLEKEKEEAVKFGLKYWEAADQHKTEIRNLLEERDDLKKDLAEFRKKKKKKPTTPELCVEYEKSKATTDPGATTAAPKTIDEALTTLCAEIAAQLDYIEDQIIEIAKANRVIEGGDATILEYEKESENLNASVREYQIANAAADKIIKGLKKSNLWKDVKKISIGLGLGALLVLLLGGGK